MVRRTSATVNLRLPLTPQPNLARLNDRVKRRRPKPKTQPRPPEYYQNLINHHNETTVKPNYADRCRPAELVDAKKKKRRWPGLKDNETSDGNVNNTGFEDAEAGADGDFGFDDHDSAVADLGFENDGNSSNNDVAITDGEIELRRFDALCYEDVRLLAVRNPVTGERDVLAIKVTVAHHKGAQRRLKPSTIFFFTEVDNPIFCPITHLVSLAITNRAFEAPSLTTIERVFKHKTPIFRQDKKPADSVVTSPTLALTYSQFRDYLNRLGHKAGFLEKLTSYWFRRGTANVVDRTATDAVRDQVMRHNPNSAVYNGAYINERVPFDVLSAVLERPSADGILRMLTYISLMRDPRAPIHVPDDVQATQTASVFTRLYLSDRFTQHSLAKQNVNKLQQGR
ncbi:hypothetical protein ACEPPN_017905 [Leptodophora sp. 'Broadleaf-Isolate-01']